MAKLSVAKGSTSVLVRVFIQDSASTTGAGKTALTAASFTGTKVYVARDDDGNAGGTAVTLTDSTRGTWSSGGIKEKDATNMPGVYEFGLTNASLLTGSRSCTYEFIGTGIAPCLVEIELTGNNNQVAAGDVNVATILGQAPTLDSNNVLNVSAKYWAGTAITATSIPVATAAGSSGGLLKIGTSPLPASGTIAAATWDELNTGSTHNITNSTGKQLRSLASSTDAIYPLSGSVNLTSATSTTATLDLLASNGSQAYQWNVLNILSGTGAGQSRIITNYTTGRVATVSPAFTTTPDATSTFDVTPTASVQVVSYIAGQDPATLVLDVAQSGHNGAGTIGHDIGLIASGVTVTGTVDANVISINGTTFAGANVPSILADGVAHGGTPGSSTATFAGKSWNLTNPSGTAFIVHSTGSNGRGIDILGNGSGHGIYCQAGDNGIAVGLYAVWGATGGCHGLEIAGAGYGAGISCNGGSLDGSGFNANGGGANGNGVDLEGVGTGQALYMRSDSGSVVRLTASTAGHGFEVLAKGSGSKAMLLSGDAATDALAIAAGAGSPIDIFNADGSVNVGNIEASALAELFTTDSAKVFSDAVNGSVVKEIATHASGGTSGPTASQIATAVWQDNTSGDFTASGSIGKSLFTGGAVPGASGGLFIAGTNAATTVTTSFTTTFTGNLTGNVGGNVTGTIGGLTAAALAMFFTVDTTKVFADAIGGSVVKEVSTGSGSDPWAVPVPGSYLAGTAGYILGNRLDASVSSRSTYSGTDTPGTLTLLSRIGGTITINGGAVAIDWAHVLNPTTAVALTGTTISPAQVIASVSGNVTGTIGGLTTAALVQFFTVNTGETYSGAVDGSIVHEIASNSSGGGTSTLTAADVWTYGTRTLTSLGATAPAGWINAGSIVDHALDGKGDWSTYAGGDTAGVTTLLSRIGGAITINGGGVNVNLAQTLGSARALDGVGDTSLSLNDAMHCAVAVAAGQRVEDKIALTYVQKTPSTGTVLRTFSIDSASAPTRRT